MPRPPRASLDPNLAAKRQSPAQPCDASPPSAPAGPMGLPALRRSGGNRSRSHHPRCSGWNTRPQQPASGPQHLSRRKVAPGPPEPVTDRGCGLGRTRASAEPQCPAAQRTARRETVRCGPCRPSPRLVQAGALFRRHPAMVGPVGEQPAGASLPWVRLGTPPNVGAAG